MQRPETSGRRSGPSSGPVMAPTHAGIPIAVVIDPASRPEALTCAICTDLVRDPVITPCNHVFCGSCMASAREHSDQCPIDRQQLPPRVPSLKTSNPCLYRVWNDIKLRCPYAVLANCTWTGCGEDYGAHAAACKVQAEAACQQAAAAQVAELQARLHALQAEVEHGRAEAAPVPSLRASVSRMTAAAASMQASLSELQLGAEEPTSQPQESSWREEAAPVASLQRDVTRLTAQAASLTRANAQLRGTCSSLQADNTRLRASNDNLALRVESLEDSLDATSVYLDPSHQYNKFRTVELTRLILQHLEDVPAGVATNRIFNCISNIHNECQRECPDNPENLVHDLRMLLAVARASNWFTAKQYGRLCDMSYNYP